MLPEPTPLNITFVIPVLLLSVQTTTPRYYLPLPTVFYTLFTIYKVMFAITDCVLLYLLSWLILLVTIYWIWWQNGKLVVQVSSQIIVRNVGFEQFALDLPATMSKLIQQPVIKQLFVELPKIKVLSRPHDTRTEITVYVKGWLYQVQSGNGVCIMLMVANM